MRRLLALALSLPVCLALLALARRARLERADFVFNNGSEVTSLDPAAISGQAEGRVADALFEGLTVKHPETLEALPGVAEAWELAPDGLTWTFDLRAARWSNGEPLTAEDFLYSWRRLLESATAAPYAALLHCVRGAEAFAAASADEAALVAQGFSVTWLRRLPTIVSADSIDWSKVWKQSRYGKGAGGVGMEARAQEWVDDGIAGRLSELVTDAGGLGEEK